MISSLLHLVGLRPRVYYTLTNFRGGGGKAPLPPPPQYANGCDTMYEVIVYRPGYFTVHPPRLQVDQNFLTQKIVADPKMQCHQKSFGIWRVTEAILDKKTCFFPKNIFWKKIIINHTIF